MKRRGTAAVPGHLGQDFRGAMQFVHHGKTLQIEVCDHIIVGNPAHISLREAGIIH